MPFHLLVKGTLEKEPQMLAEDGHFMAFWQWSLALFRKCDLGGPTARAVSAVTEIARFSV